ncbi:MAG: glycerol kinase GlpK [Burkholderiales bacterium]
MAAILALDQGTTSSRALVFDEGGRVLGLAQREFRQIFPHSGWVEHDPEEIWTSQLATARQAIAGAGLTAGDIVALGIANQRETTVVWDRASGQPVANAIVWQDRRTAASCSQMRAQGLESLFTGRTGLLLDPYFSGTKLAWLLDNVHGLRARAERGEIAFGTIDTWLIWNLTGGRVHVTDATNASRTLMFNIHHGDWDDKLLSLLRVPRAVLPGIVPSSAVLGETEATLFGSALPIAGVAGDQQAALFGQQCTGPGLVKNTYGTGCFMLMHTGNRAVASHRRLLSTVAAKIGERLEYALEGSVFVGGAAVQWLRDGLGIIRSSGEVESLAGSVRDTGDVYFVPAFAGLGAPYWDPNARGTLVGLSRGSTAAHIARATLESIAHQSADLLDAMQGDAGTPMAEMRVDGGASRNNLLMQIQADLLGVSVVRPKVTETTALGAAYLAGLAVGVWKTAGTLAEQWQLDRRFEPQLGGEQRARQRARWAGAVKRARAWIDSEGNV